MAGNLPDSMENALLDHMHGVATLTIATPIKCRAMTTNGNDSTNGTEVTGGSYAPANVTMAAASGGGAVNSTPVAITNMPACTVTGVELWDSSGTPKRLWWMPLAANKVLQAGDTFSLAAGAITTAMD